jgi:hypothetical protein
MVVGVGLTASISGAVFGIPLLALVARPWWAATRSVQRHRPLATTALGHTVLGIVMLTGASRSAFSSAWMASTLRRMSSSWLWQSCGSQCAGSQQPNGSTHNCRPRARRSVLTIRRARAAGNGQPVSRGWDSCQPNGGRGLDVLGRRNRHQHALLRAQHSLLG